jgi:hypothetical protein
VAKAIAELAPLGFSMGELAVATGLDSKSSALRTGIKNAVAAKQLYGFGEKRFARYGKTEKIAKTRNEADRAGK